MTLTGSLEPAIHKIVEFTESLFRLSTVARGRLPWGGSGAQSPRKIARQTPQRRINPIPIPRRSLFRRLPWRVVMYHRMRLAGSTATVPKVLFFCLDFPAGWITLKGYSGAVSPHKGYSRVWLGTGPFFGDETCFVQKTSAEKGTCPLPRCKGIVETENRLGGFG